MISKSGDELALSADPTSAVASAVFLPVGVVLAAVSLVPVFVYYRSLDGGRRPSQSTHSVCSGSTFKHGETKVTVAGLRGGVERHAASPPEAQRQTWLPPTLGLESSLQSWLQSMATICPSVRSPCAPVEHSPPDAVGVRRVSPGLLYFFGLSVEDLLHGVSLSRH